MLRKFNAYKSISFLTTEVITTVIPPLATKNSPNPLLLSALPHPELW
jgi:hypothetical protein